MLRVMLLAGFLLPAAAAAGVAAAAPHAAVAPSAAAKTFTNTGAQFWTWALTQRAVTNPLLDPTGKFCKNGQHGPTWFLAADFNGSPASPITRACTVPAKKALVFPLANAFSGWVPTEPAAQRKVAFHRAEVAFVKDGATGMSVTVDGKKLSPSRIRYEESRVFAVRMPKDNVFGAVAPGPVLVNPTVDAGYYVHLNPLSSGRHTIHFRGTLVSATTDVTYTLFVQRP